MIGTHNSLTCYSPKKWWAKPFKFLWRCQNKTLFEQLEDGVKYFDIRIRLDKNKNICFCHGLVDVDCPFSLSFLLKILSLHGAKCRILIERGSVPDMKSIESIPNVITQIIVKHNWEIKVNNDTYPIKDYCYVPWHSDYTFWENLKKLKFSTIKKWAQAHNPIINDNIKKDNIIHFMDFYNFR